MTALILKNLPNLDWKISYTKRCLQGIFLKEEVIFKTIRSQFQDTTGIEQLIGQNIRWMFASMKTIKKIKKHFIRTKNHEYHFLSLEARFRSAM